MSVLSRLARLCAELLREDPRRVVLGEDVASGGLLGLTRAAAEDEALRPRLLGAPLVPAAAIAHATGLALAGLRPLMILPSATALLEGYAALRELARLRLAGGGERGAPVVFLAPSGPGFGLGGDGAESCEDALCAVAGLRVIALGRADEAVATVRAAAASAIEPGDPPTVVLLPRALLLEADSDADAAADARPRPLGAARLVREGDACTVFAWGGATALALRAADASGHAAAVVDLGGLQPLDGAAVIDAAARTGKVVIVHQGPRSAVAAEVAALCADRAILHLDAPILRVGGEGGPLVAPAEAAALPAEAAVIAAIQAVVTY